MVEGHQADFHCSAKTTKDKTFTVAFLIKVPPYSLTECTNYTFSTNASLLPLSLSGNGSCSGLDIIPTFLYGTHYLRATWPSVNLSMSGAEVVCAQASSGVTQWARTATLTVLPASIVPLYSPTHPDLSVLAVLTLPLIVLVVVLAILLWWKWRRFSMTKFGYQLQREQSKHVSTLVYPSHFSFPAPQAVPSSTCSTPTNATPQFPLLASHPYVTQHKLLHAANEDSESSNCEVEVDA